MGSNKDTFFTSIYNTLSKGSESFKSAFLCNDDLLTFFNEMQSCSTNLLNDRKKQYDTDGSKSTELVGTALKTIPELNIDDTTPYIQAARRSEKIFLEHCDAMNELITAVESDVSAFGCEEITVCSMMSDSWLFFFICSLNLSMFMMSGFGVELRIFCCLTNVTSNKYYHFLRYFYEALFLFSFNLTM